MHNVKLSMYVSSYVLCCMHMYASKILRAQLHNMSMYLIHANVRTHMAYTVLALSVGISLGYTLLLRSYGHNSAFEYLLKYLSS